MTTVVIGAGEMVVGYMTANPTLMVMGAATIVSGLMASKTQGPHVGDLRLQVSQYGWCIPRYFATDRGDGDVIWQADPVRHEQRGDGKGGPSAPPTVSWTCSYAVLICKGVIDGISHIWEDGRLVYDGTNGDDYPFTLYYGTEDQLPDPTMESYLGAGNVNANRGNAYIVFTDKPLGPSGNRIAQHSFLVSRGGATHTDHALSIVVQNNASGFTFENAAAGEATNGPGIVSWPNVGSTDLIRARETFTTNVRTYDPDDLSYVGVETAGVGDDWEDAVYITYSGAPEWYYRFVGYYKYANDTTVPLWGVSDWRVDRVANNPLVTNEIGVPLSSTVPTKGAPQPGIPYVIDGTNFCSIAGITATDRVHGYAPSNDRRMLCVFVCTAAQAAIDRSFVDKWYRIINGVVTSSGTITPPLSGFVPLGSAARPQAIVVGAMFENDYTHCWVSYTNAFLVTVYKIDDSGNFAQAAAHYVGPPAGSGGALILTGDPNVAGGHLSCIFALPGGCRAGYIYGGSLWLIERCDIQSGVMRLDAVVAELSDDTGRLTAAQYDVTQLHNDIVPGYKIGVQATTRACIQQLMQRWFFEGVEVDCQIQFVKLGRQPVLSIDDDDLGAFPADSEPIAQLVRNRAREAALPKIVYCTYPDPALDYQDDTQPSQRMTGSAAAVVTMQLPIVMDKNAAQQTASIHLYSAHYQRDSGQMVLPRKYARLVPTDVINVLSDVVRLQTEQESLQNGVTNFDFVRTSSHLYAQGALGAPAEGFVPQVILAPQGTELAVLDLPLYDKNEARQSVHRVAMQGKLRRAWVGGDLEKSIDGGANYSSLLTSTVPDSMGRALTALPNFGSGNITDEASTLRVQMGPGAGELESVTNDAMMAGANSAVVACELVNYRNADFVGYAGDGVSRIYDLSGFLRGQDGTEEWMRSHAIDDLFCKLPTSITIDAVHSEYGRTIPYKAPTLGRALSTADEFDFRSNAISLAPYAPVHPRQGFDGSNTLTRNCIMAWDRRTRFSPGWSNFRAPTYQDSMPLGEATETYQVQIWLDGTYQVVLRTELVHDTTQYVYTPAKMIEDFGSVLTTPPAWSVAQMGARGPGYDTLGRLPPFVPDDTGGFEPPNPPPTDGILTVMSWVAPTRMYSGTFGQNDSWSIETTTGGTSSGSDLPHFNVVEYGGPPSGRRWTLSLIRGDFGPQPYPGAQGSGSPSVTAAFAVGSGSGLGFYRVVPLHTTIYLNIRNEPSGYTDMPMSVDLVKTFT